MVSGVKNITDNGSSTGVSPAAVVQDAERSEVS